MIIAVMNQKGGVGKSTLSTNIAACAHLSGKRVQVIDCDPQGSALDWFAARDASSPLRGLRVVKADKALRPAQISDVAEGFDVTIIDTPPRLHAVGRSIALCADLAVIPLSPGPYDLWSAAETIDMLGDADETRKDMGRNAIRRLMVINRASARTTLLDEVKDALENAHTTVAKTIIHSRVAFPESASKGESVLSSGSDKKAKAELLALYEEIKRHMKGQIKKGTAKQGERA